MRDDLDIPVPLGGPSYRVSRASGGMDANTKRLMLLAGGIGGVLALLVGAWSLTGHRRSGVPVIEAAAGPVRVKPANPGGLQIFGSDDAGPGAGQDSNASVAPPPEAPDPQGLRAQEAKPPAPPVTTPAPPVSAAIPPASPAPAVVARTPPAAAPATPPVPGTAPGPAPGAAKAEPVSMPRPAPPTRVPPAAAPAAATPATADGGTQVQLAALTSEEQALAEWSRLARRMPDLFGARHPAVTRTEHDGRTWFRLRTGGFADMAQATTFCQRVREKGAACAIASF